ncbi:MAG: glutathione S-transferase family protein [Rhodospirillales bacterium]
MPEQSRPLLAIGNKAYSSWSMRAGLILDHAGIDCEEVIIPLRQDDTKARILAHSPAGKVPVLILADGKGGQQAIWDSLAICEWAAERNPEAGLLPADPLARAVCRSAAAEMHSGFQTLRQRCPMNIRMTFPTPPLSAELAADIERIFALWSDCRSRFGAGGPFLFGGYSIADAQFAPVVSRFRTYGIGGDAVVEAYMVAVTTDAAYRKWAEAGMAEPWHIADLDRPPS